MTELISSFVQILIQMQTHIEQLEEQHQQQNLKIDKLNQFNKIKKTQTMISSNKYAHEHTILSTQNRRRQNHANY